MVAAALHAIAILLAGIVALPLIWASATDVHVLSAPHCHNPDAPGTGYVETKDGRPIIASGPDCNLPSADAQDRTNGVELPDGAVATIATAGILDAPYEWRDGPTPLLDSPWTGGILTNALRIFGVIILISICAVAYRAVED